MTFDVPTILFGAVSFLLLAWWLRQPKTKNLPPGPWNWPLLGCLPNFALLKYRSGLPLPHLFNSLAKKYGPVFSMDLGGNKVVVLNTFKYVKEAFNHPNLCDRPSSVLKDGLPKGMHIPVIESFKCALQSKNAVPVWAPRKNNVSTTAEGCINVVNWLNMIFFSRHLVGWTFNVI